ncbi:MAG: glycosyltransferase family 2 protein [Desulfobulbus oligotrophicus]|jgi:glycosyltransferase involved in cell wall biosynthesis|nr:glycosyltransferase family 2 protein [Desulfobulbus oligotrophicus]
MTRFDASTADTSMVKDELSSQVAILLCTYQGQAYLAEQLDSFTGQTYNNWRVWASDDNSQDNTAAILQAYQQKWLPGSLTICCGPNQGFVANFLSLTCNVKIKAAYYAYADQDDIWEPDKLERAVQWLKTIPANIPALYCSRTRLVDARNNEIGFSPLFSKPPSFANALMQNIASGNTMVFNNAARSLLYEAGEKIPVVIHDWWVYMVVTGCGGHVFYDPTPTLRYRQHDSNLIGMNATWAARCNRLRSYWQGSFQDWSDRNIKCLQKLRHRITPKNLEILEQFTKARTMPLFQRLIHLKKSGIHRQTLSDNLGLIAATIFKKI